MQQHENLLVRCNFRHFKNGVHRCRIVVARIGKVTRFNAVQGHENNAISSIFLGLGIARGLLCCFFLLFVTSPPTQVSFHSLSCWFICRVFWAKSPLIPSHQALFLPSSSEVDWRLYTIPYVAYSTPCTSRSLIW